MKKEKQKKTEGGKNTVTEGKEGGVSTSEGIEKVQPSLREIQKYIESGT